MKSVVILVILFVALGAVGYFKVWPEIRAQREAAARHVAQARQAAAEAPLRAKQAEEAKQVKAEQERAAAEQARIRAEQAEIATTLQGMKVTSIMPGSPGIVIIEKHEYAEGDALPVGKGRDAKITAVRDDGVALACDGLTFHLDPPAAPDLAALRKR